MGGISTVMRETTFRQALNPLIMLGSAWAVRIVYEFDCSSNVNPIVLSANGSLQRIVARAAGPTGTLESRYRYSCGRARGGHGSSSRHTANDEQGCDDLNA